MKRIWALLLGVVLSVSLTACAENNLDQMYIEEAQLTEEEKKWLKKIAQKSDLLKNPNPQRGRK